MTHPTSAEIAGRIEDLYGAPLAALASHVQDQPSGILSALLGLHDTLAFAERSIAVHRERLTQLVHTDRHISTYEVPHVLDCARRLAEAVAVRDTQAVTASAVLHSLVRVEPPEPPEPFLAPPSTAVATAPAAGAASAAPSR
ncbi:hypothetical protein ABZX74_23880 [Streptomyces olivaceoviridis]|uniref:hypothetical protein n=1 Tax=Streptomyces olivaceoviridis TaxID=1921 RepID=UPI0033B223E0